MLALDLTSSLPSAPSFPSTASLVASHWSQLFALLYYPSFLPKDSSAALQPLLFPLLEATIPCLADRDITFFHACIEKTLFYFFAILPSTISNNDSLIDATSVLPIEPVKRLVLRMADALPESALPHILDLILDFIFSPEADGIVRPSLPVM